MPCCTLLIELLLDRKHYFLNGNGVMTCITCGVILGLHSRGASVKRGSSPRKGGNRHLSRRRKRKFTSKIDAAKHSSTTKKGRQNFANRFVKHSQKNTTDPLAYLAPVPSSNRNDNSTGNAILDLKDGETAVVTLPALASRFGDVKAFRNGVPGGGPCGYHCLIRALLSSNTGLTIAQNVFHVTNKDYNITAARKAFVTGLADHTYASFSSLAGKNLKGLQDILMKPKKFHLGTMAISIFAVEAKVNVVVLTVNEEKAKLAEYTASVDIYGSAGNARGGRTYCESNQTLILYLRSNSTKTGGHYELISDKDHVKLFSHENRLLQNVLLGHQTQVQKPLRDKSVGRVTRSSSRLKRQQLNQ